MKVFLTPIGSAGDNYPFIGLGAELKRRGHEVAIFANEHFAPLVRQCGLEFVQVGTDQEYRATTDNPDLWHGRKGFQTVMGLVANYHQRLLKELRPRVADGGAGGSGRTMVVAHTLDWVSRSLQERTGLPVVSIHLQPAILRSLHEMPVMTGTLDLSHWPRWIKRAFWMMAGRMICDPVVAPSLNALRAELGLAPVRDVFGDWLHSPLLTVAMFPDWFAPRQPDWPQSVRQTSFPLFDAPEAQRVPAEVNAFLNESRNAPPVVFTPGSAMKHGDEFFAAAVGACAKLGRRAMLLSRHREHIPSALPPGVRHFDFAPLSEMLSRCAGIVHHGGIGTTAAGLAAGVPQVIMPMSHDQPDNAARVTRLGVGQRLARREFVAPRLAEMLESILRSSEIASRCRQIATWCRQINGIAATCDLIESAMR